jgi:hypothetical protein
MKITATVVLAVIVCAEVAAARCFFWGRTYYKEEAATVVLAVIVRDGSTMPAEPKMACSREAVRQARRK